MSVITAQNEARKQFQAIEDERNAQAKLETEYQKMERILSDLSKPALIEQKAREHLNMYVPTDARQSVTAQTAVAM